MQEKFTSYLVKNNLLPNFQPHTLRSDLKQLLVLVLISHYILH